MSIASTIPLFGRAYELTAYSEQGQEIITSDAWEPEALRMTFDILETTLPSPYWYADIIVYNFNKPEAYNLISSAYRVTLKAGYQTGANKANIIWDGPVFQVLFDRQNVVDQTFTFHCVATIPELSQNIINFSQNKLSTQAQVLSRMVSQIGVNVDKSPMANKLLSAKQYVRGKTLFGSLPDYLSQLGDDQFLTHYMDGVKAYLSEIAPSGNALPPVALIYSPPDPPGYVTSLGSPSSVNKTIIGVPRQTQFGATFQVLLDPRVKVTAPPMLIHIDNTVISQMKQMIGQYIAPLDTKLNFFAAQIRHHGDTRGNDWYTQIDGFNPQYAIGLLGGNTTP